ncbi:MAG: ferritin-like domain-containing protein [Actinomycetota bacterium]|nr:ferritin-like domain-containing protein [Actinomycetota bacterium]
MATKVTDPNDLFVYKLGVLLKTETAIESMLPRLQKEANNAELASGFERHTAETRQQIQNIERVFEALGVRPEALPAPAVEGLEAEYKGFAASAADDVQPDVLDVVALGAAAATEHHEIAAYESLITLAGAVGAEDAVPLLEENLEQERNMLQQVQSFAQRLGEKHRQESAAI